MLVRMAHRGAVGCDRQSGDGAGILVNLPQRFMQRVVHECGFELGTYQKEVAMGNVFFGREDRKTDEAKLVFEQHAHSMGYSVVGTWCGSSWEKLAHEGIFLLIHIRECIFECI